MSIRAAFRNKKIKSILAASWSVSWPMTLIMFFIFLIGLADVFIAGKFGKEVQAAYGVAYQIYFIFGIIGFALTVGAVSVVSRLFTSGKKEDLAAAVETTLFSAAVTGVVVGMVCVVLARQIISWLNIPGELKIISIPFLRIYGAGLFLHYLVVSTNGILRACGMVRKSLWTMAVVCVTNVVLNFYLAFYTPLGFRGIAWSTVISMVFGTIINLRYVRGLMNKTLRFSPAMVKTIFQISWPAGLLQVFWQSGAMVLYLILSKLPRQNIEIMAAFTNGLKIESLVFLPAFAFNMANAVVVGNLLGKKENNDAFDGGILTASAGVFFVLLMTAGVLLNARHIAAWLSDDPAVIQACVTYIYISLAFEPVMAWGVILAGGMNGAGDTRSVMLIVAGSIWLVRIPLSYLFGIHFQLGHVAVWWAMNLSILTQTIFLARHWFSRRWLCLAETNHSP